MNFTEAITRHARQRPWAVAVIDRDRIVHYRTFDTAIDRAAAWLKRQGIAHGDMVGISMPGTALHLVVAYALGRIGAVQLALMQIDNAEARQALAARFRIGKIIGSAPDLRAIAMLEPRPEWLDPAGRPDDAPFAPEPAAEGVRINLSSGTTGRPKAVLCAGGLRSSTVISALARAGLTDWYNVIGGMTAWQKGGYSTVRRSAP